MAREPTRGFDEELPPPALKAMLVCDRIIREANTDKVTVVGILDRVTTHDFPFDYVRGLGIYVRITDAAGEYAIRVDVVTLDDERIVGRRDVTTLILDRTAAHELIFDLASVTFERPGEYEFRLLANSRFVASAVLLVESAA